MDSSQVDHPRVRMAMDAFFRDKSYVPRKKDALSMDEMAKGLAAIPHTPIGDATRAGVLVMFYGALRQSEVAPPTKGAFDPTRHPTRADIARVKSGIRMTVKWAKNMQRVGQSRTVILPHVPDQLTCPVTAIQANTMACPTVSGRDPL